MLKGLICSLLHLKPEQIKCITIINPINLAGDVTGKEFILDIHVMLKDDTLINLEMQVANEHNWTEFYSTYKMLNVKTHGIYSNRFILSVVQIYESERKKELMLCLIEQQRVSDIEKLAKNEGCTQLYEEFGL